MDEKVENLGWDLPLHRVKQRPLQGGGPWACAAGFQKVPNVVIQSRLARLVPQTFCLAGYPAKSVKVGQNSW